MWPCSRQGRPNFAFLLLVPQVANLLAKLKVSSFSRSRNMEGVPKWFWGAWGMEIFWISIKAIGNHIWESTLVASLVNIGGKLRSVERSTRFVWQTHLLTHSLTDTQTNFIICAMLLTHLADNNCVGLFVMLQISTNVQQTTQVVALMPAALTL